MGTCPYMHYVGLNDCMITVLLTWMKLSSPTCWCMKKSVKACGVMIGLLNIYEVVGIHIYVPLIDLE